MATPSLVNMKYFKIVRSTLDDVYINIYYGLKKAHSIISVSSHTAHGQVLSPARKYHSIKTQPHDS